MNVAGPPMSGGKMLVTSSTLDMRSAVGDSREAAPRGRGNDARLAHVALPRQEHQQRPEAVAPVAPASQVLHPLPPHFRGIEDRVVLQVALGEQLLGPF